MASTPVIGALPWACWDLAVDGNIANVAEVIKATAIVLVRSLAVIVPVFIKPRHKATHFVREKGIA